jgi:hypothetical protein
MQSKGETELLDAAGVCRTQQKFAARETNIKLIKRDSRETRDRKQVKKSPEQIEIDKKRAVVKTVTTWVEERRHRNRKVRVDF